MANSKEQDILKAELKKLLKLPENARCADCNTQGPTWASTNLGVFICMRCSGIHRSLGTHISKVKSTVLDNWAPHMVARMASVGNDVARRMYEDGVPKNYPRNFTDQHQLVSWITNKYQFKKWFNESEDPDMKGEEEEGRGISTKTNHHQNSSVVRSVVSAPSTPSPSSIPSFDAFSPDPSKNGFANFDAFGGGDSNNHHAPQDLFQMQFAPSNGGVSNGGGSTHQNASSNHHLPLLHHPNPSLHSSSLPATPNPPSHHHHDLGSFQGASSQQEEPDLFSIPISQHHQSQQQQHHHHHQPHQHQQKTVDKSQLMSMYSSTPFAQQHHQSQQQQSHSFSLEQQAFLAQQHIFQQQLHLMNPQHQNHHQNYASSFNHPSSFTSPTTPPTTAISAPSSQNLFNPQPSSSQPFASFSPSSTTTSSSSTSSFPSFSSTSTPPLSSNNPSSALASLYASTPSSNHHSHNHHSNNNNNTNNGFNTFGSSSAHQHNFLSQPTSLI